MASSKRPKTPFAQLEKNVRAVFTRLPGEASVIAQTHFIQNFERQGYYDQAGRLVQWKPRSFDGPGKRRALLIKSGRLRREIRPMPGPLTARVVAGAPYARLQNRGGEVVITKKMRRFFWAMHMKTKDAYTSGKVNKEADFWKAMALAKGPLKIPARRFMNSNPVLLNQIRSHTFNRLQTVFKHS